MELRFNAARRRCSIALWVLFGLLMLALSTKTWSDSAQLLTTFTDNHPASSIIAQADRYGAADEHGITPLLRGSEVAGYAFVNSTLVNAVGYAGKPIHVVVALDTEGEIQAAKLVKHHEPIVLIGIPESKITALIDGYIGLNVIEHLKQQHKTQRFDAISGATVTVRVIDDSIIRSAIKVARLKAIGGLTTPKVTAQRKTLSNDETLRDWETLLSQGAISQLKLTADQIDAVFAGKALEGAAISETSSPPFVDIFAAQVSVPSIGLSLLGVSEYNNLKRQLKPGQQAILLAGRGEYSYKGSGYVRGGIFDRFEVVQGDEAIRFRDLNHKRLRTLATDDSPQDFREIDLFVVPESASFQAVKPWQLHLIVSRESDAQRRSFYTFTADYQLPDAYLNKPPAATASSDQASQNLFDAMEGTPLWRQLWQEKTVEITVLCSVLVLVTLIFFFQDSLVKRPVLLRRLRVGVLLYTLFVLGFYSSGQLSVVNIMTVFNALLTGFSWEYFLMEPITFILWGSVIAGLLFWGRGAYCGWMCPFGALQELLNNLAKKLKVPQITVPWAVHERLWPIKYLIFLGLFGVSLHSLTLAEQLAEVEPFKTAIILKFARHWPFVLFAVAVLAAGIFIERFYCRYLCPLGAALAIPGRLRMFEWLKRYRACGDPCKTCANECMVQAIHPEGHINPNECLYCLHCQELYYNEHRCPVMVKKRKRREARDLIASTDTLTKGTEILQNLKEQK